MTGPRSALRPSLPFGAPAWATVFLLAGAIACSPKQPAEGSPQDTPAQPTGAPQNGSPQNGQAPDQKRDRPKAPEDSVHQSAARDREKAASSQPAQPPPKRDPIVSTEADPDPVKKLDVVPFNTLAKGTSTGACPSFLTGRGSMCVQQGKPVTLDDTTRVAVLKLLSERTNWTATRPVYCWAPRHALVLFDKAGKDLGWIDLSLPCGKARSGDSNGALVTKEGFAFEQLTLSAWRELAGLLKGAGVDVGDVPEQQMKEAESSKWAKEAKPGELPPLPLKSQPQR